MVASRPTRCSAAGVALVVAALVTVMPSAASAQDPRAQAREHFRKGTRHYDLGEYGEALTEYKEAYRRFDDPAFLFNIAQCHRRLGERDLALDRYRAYLRKSPEAENRADVERLIAELERQRSAAPAAAPAAPQEPAASLLPAQREAGWPSTASSAADAPRAGAQIPVAQPAIVERQSEPGIGRSWLIWGGVAAGVVAAAAVVFLVTRAPDGPGCPTGVECL